MSNIDTIIPDNEMEGSETQESITEHIPLSDELQSEKSNSNKSLPIKETPTKKRKISNPNPMSEKVLKIMEQRQEERNMLFQNIKKKDSIDLFFESIAISVKQLQPHLINEAKIKTLQLVCELEQKNNMPSSSSVSYYLSPSSSYTNTPVPTPSPQEYTEYYGNTYQKL